VGRDHRVIPVMTSSSREIVRKINDFLRECGCQFSADAPGRVIKQWVADLDPNGAVPNLQMLAKLLAVSDIGFGYSDEAEKEFSLLWRMLVSQRDSLAAIRSALGAMRVFRTLPKGSDILDAARDKFLEGILSDSSVGTGNRRGAP
jgi:hypothetical protein